MVTLDGKDKVLAPGKCFSTPMSSVLGLWTPISKANTLLPGVVYMCDMVTLIGEEGNILEPRNCISISMSSALDL
jgi:hypothetical protein